MQRALYATELVIGIQGLSGGNELWWIESHEVIDEDTPIVPIVLTVAWIGVMRNVLQDICHTLMVMFDPHQYLHHGWGRRRRVLFRTMAIQVAASVPRHPDD